MKHRISVALQEEHLVQISGITYAQVPYWFPYPYHDLKMDLIKPIRFEGKRPVLVWICGGGFMTTERSTHIPWLTRLARKGWIIAAVDYRLCNAVPMPAPIQDVKAAIRYLRAHADLYGIDPERIAVGGESAGACVATMVGVTSGVKMLDEKTAFDIGENLEYTSSVKAVVNFYGPADFRPKEETGDRPSFAARALGFAPAADPKRAEAMSAYAYIKKDTPAFFLAHGTQDRLISVDSSEELYQALTEKGVRTDFYIVEGADHFAPEFYQEEMAVKVTNFLNEMV